MTEVRFLYLNEILIGFHIKGHSTASAEDEIGRLVCASISSAAYLTANTDTEIVGAKTVADVDEKNTEEYQKMLADFSKISVREEAGKAIVKKISGQDSVQTLDPTLLLNKQQWSALIENREKLLIDTKKG